MDAPTYKQPTLDPSFMSLMDRNKQQLADDALGASRHDIASDTARYGALTSGDTSMILARYGAQLALANAGRSNELTSLLGKAT